MSDSHPTISFTASTFSADTGCNTIHGTYTGNPDGYTITGADTTLRGCPPAITAQDYLLTKAINTDAKVTVTGNTLTIAGQGILITGTHGATP